MPGVPMAVAYAEAGSGRRMGTRDIDEGRLVRSGEGPITRHYSAGRVDSAWGLVFVA